MATLPVSRPDLADTAHVLLEHGCCIVRNALPLAAIGALDRDLAPHFERTPFGRGAFYGTTTKRFGRLLLRSPHTAALVQHPAILAAVEAVLAPWCDCIQLNTTQAIGIHPGAPAQLPHRDQKRGSHASAPHSWRKHRLPHHIRYATVGS